ncbi:S9 family peptidase [Pedobacter duraquae]|uniref:Dipeptidyl aminopeptidase/acylaminoacyl peptidase n=1 Tax=Pedobacter duraquae TaxID=425511 RepID=A0A4R6II12_9SPHI|nr:prolyl oligopeptidase family serine peptidase [Pedobacter duraquae]TDO21573.1 dipeptidyl aminopeptidase/acylaminoacyl peptidase [Pedobacter duraquae]
MMNGYKKFLWFALLPLWFACKPGKGKLIPVNDFFKSQDKVSFALSPNGKTLSYLKLTDKVQNIFIENTEGGESVQVTKLSEKGVGFYFWVSDNELIYYKDKQGPGRQSDVFIIDKSGNNQRQLNDNAKSRMRVLKDQLIDNKYLLVSSNKRDSTVFDVYRLNVRDGKMEMAARNPGNITDWITDSKGKLRLATSSDGVNETLLYRENENMAFTPILTNNFKTTLKPIAFAETRPHTIYAISSVNRDKNALVELDCNTGKETRVLFANDTLNVVDAQYSRNKKRMAFVVCETWKKEKFYLDDTVKAFYAKLDKLLPKTESRIIDRDKAENVFIVRTFTDKNPGSYYLYFADKGVIRKLSDFNSAIREEQMSEMKPISFISRDGLKINGYLTMPINRPTKNLPVVVLPHNGPGNRNTWGYNAEVQFLASRGYAVFQVNFRGSSGYGKEFMAAGFKQWGGKINNDINDGVNWLIKQHIANPKRIGIYGVGLGGYLALNSVYSSPGLYNCAASNSGVINLFSYLKAVPPFLKTNLQMYYTIIGNPDTEVDYMRQASPVFHSDKIDVPVFIAQSPKDQWVNSGEVIQFVKELKKKNVNVTYFEKDKESFPIPNEESRQHLYVALEQFLDVNLKKK